MFSNKKVKFDPPEIFENLKTGIKPQEFKVIRDLIMQIAGIKLNESKTTLVESRLTKRLRAFGFETFRDYIEELKKNQSELEVFINALTTNKTEFFREPDHFDFLTKQCLPEFVVNNRNHKLRIWSAASSTGEEIYTLAIVLNEYFSDRRDWDYKILGTDIDTDVLASAVEGTYKKDVVAPVPPYLLQKYFTKTTIENRLQYLAGNKLKEIIKFRKFNLIQDFFPFQMEFDVIFLRNVLIYFDTETIQLVINKMYKQLKPGGYLFIGHSETLNNIKHNFKLLQSSIYFKG